MSSGKKGPIESITLLKQPEPFEWTFGYEAYEQSFLYNVYNQTCTPAWVVDISKDSRESVRWRDIIKDRSTQRWRRVNRGIKEELEATIFDQDDDLYFELGVRESVLQYKYEGLIDNYLEGRGVTEGLHRTAHFLMPWA